MANLARNLGARSTFQQISSSGICQMVMFRDPMHRHTAEDGKLSIDEKLSVLIPAIHHLDRRRQSTASTLSASSSILSWILAWFLLKSLKWHLAVHYGPDGYREKWGLKPGLPDGYPDLRGSKVDAR